MHIIHLCAVSLPSTSALLCPLYCVCQAPLSSGLQSPVAHRRLQKKTGRGWEGRCHGHSFSLVNWHVQKEEVSSSLVLQWQLRVAWVTLAAVGAVIAAATPQRQAPTPPT